MLVWILKAHREMRAYGTPAKEIQRLFWILLYALEQNKQDQAIKVGNENNAIYNKCVLYLYEKIMNSKRKREIRRKRCDGLWFGGARGVALKLTYYFLRS